ncbi:MAG TPA: hypothetical protein VLI04_02735 [Nocardioidaceae bacterium]|nr:hypothetical protein [Nocardioidaceae bacterium]
MRTKLTVALLLAVLGFYCVLVTAKGIDLIRGGGVVPILLGIALVISAFLGVLLAWREVQFGRRTAVLGAALAAEGGLPVDDLPRRPSGRVDRAAADAVFAERQAEAEATPEDWRAWYRLALAYDAAGDRTRARAAARHALTLYS